MSGFGLFQFPGPDQTQEHRRKRRRYNDHDLIDTFQDSFQPPHIAEDITLPDNDIWANSTFLYLGNPEPHPQNEAAPAEDADDILNYPNEQEGHVWDPLMQYDESWNVNGFPEWSVQDIVQLEPALPSKDGRVVDTSLVNPFADNAENHLPQLKLIPTELPEDGAVNGYIKFRLRKSDITESPTDGKANQPLLQPGELPIHHRQVPTVVGEVKVIEPPSGFGLGCKLDSVDLKLFKFYLVAFCQGRTILPRSNSWYSDIGPMLAGSPYLRHTLLSLSSTYVLDYLPDEKLRIRANTHYRKAVELLSKALSDPSEQEVGKGDALVGAITLFNMHDVITWEHRRAKNQVPRWLEGARLASKILDSTDPGYRYWKPHNIQCNAARISNTIIVGRAAILALPMTPLDAVNTEGQFGWLLHGTEEEARRIHGGCGFSPKLLHIFSQITHLAARLAEDPESVIIPLAARRIRTRLEHFRQWSDLSRGYSSTEALLHSCLLNEDGVIDTADKMTDLTAQAWLNAAQVYLHCRLFRLPRTHPLVLDRLTDLADCIRRMPCAGPLFTAQAPFFPAFLLSLISTRPEHYEVAHGWFETVITATSCRSSVPPAWQASQRLKLWVDEHIDAYAEVDDLLVGQREAWWEDMVARVMETEGTLCLI